MCSRTKQKKFKNQNPARGRKHCYALASKYINDYLRTRTPQGDGNYARRKKLQKAKKLI